MPARMVVVGLALCLVPGAARAEAPRTFGKSSAQILAMGSEKWMDYQGTKAGQSTGAMTEGMEAYRGALRWRNDGLSRRSKAAGRVGKLRGHLVELTRGLVEIGSYRTGGGTIWANIGAGALSASEEVLYPLLGGPAKKPRSKPHTTAEVKRALEELRQLTETRSREPDVTPAAHAEALKSFDRVRKSWAETEKIAATFDRAGSDNILGFCLEQIRTAHGDS